MKARIEQRGRRTVLHITAEPEKRPKKTGRHASAKAFYARRLVEGRCFECGKRRERHKYRCNKCQARENERWKRKYGDNFATMPKGIRVPARKKRNVSDFLQDLAGWQRVGWNVAERIRRRRRHRRNG